MIWKSDLPPSPECRLFPMARSKCSANPEASKGVPGLPRFPRREQKGSCMIHETNPFISPLPALTVIPTDLVESEVLIRKLADQAQAAAPQDFAGKASCVYFRFRYVSPCEKFHELRKLILRVQEATGLRANFRGIVAMDATEWLGHEREEYFRVMLKFLYDHLSLWRPAMILTNCSEQSLSRFVSACAKIIRPRICRQMIFSDPKQLTAYIHTFLHENDRLTSKSNAALLADVLSRKDFADARSLTLIQRTVQELIQFAPDKKIISEGVIQEYLEQPDNMLTMMAGNSITFERSVAHEDSIL